MDLFYYSLGEYAERYGFYSLRNEGSADDSVGPDG